MNKKILVGSIFAVALIALLPISSVVGSNVAKSNTENKHIVSPLFAVRSQSFLQKGGTQRIDSNFIGKGRSLNLFSTKKSSILELMDRSVKLLKTNPYRYNRIIERLMNMPEVIDLMYEQGIERDELYNYFNQIRKDPSILQQELTKAMEVVEIQQEQPGSDPEPLGLSTSNPLGCFIVMFALIPAALVIAMLIGTLVIVTCLNINGCLEDLLRNILEAFMQGLTPPRYG